VQGITIDNQEIAVGRKSIYLQWLTGKATLTGLGLIENFREKS